MAPMFLFYNLSIPHPHSSPTMLERLQNHILLKYIPSLCLQGDIVLLLIVTTYQCALCGVSVLEVLSLRGCPTELLQQLDTFVCPLTVSLTHIANYVSQFV